VPPATAEPELVRAVLHALEGIPDERIAGWVGVRGWQTTVVLLGGQASVPALCSAFVQVDPQIGSDRASRAESHDILSVAPDLSVRIGRVESRTARKTSEAELHGSSPFFNMPSTQLIRWSGLRITWKREPEFPKCLNLASAPHTRSRTRGRNYSFYDYKGQAFRP
jgi:hypothetical protein